MDPAALLLAALPLLALSIGAGVRIARRLRPSEARLAEARELVARDEHRRRVEAQWPTLLLLARLHEEELARLSSRTARADMVRLLDDESGADVPQAVRVALAASPHDDFSGGPSGVTGPHRRVK